MGHGLISLLFFSRCRSPLMRLSLHNTRSSSSHPAGRTTTSSSSSPRRLEASCSDPGTRLRPPSAAPSNIVYDEQDAILASLKTNNSKDDHSQTNDDNHSHVAKEFTPSGLVEAGCRRSPDLRSRQRRNTGTSPALLSSLSSLSINVERVNWAPESWDNGDRSRSSRTNSDGGDEESLGSTRRRRSSSSTRRTGPPSLSEEDDISPSPSSSSSSSSWSSSSGTLPETIKKNVGRLEHLAQEIQLLNTGLSAMVDEGHQLLGWSVSNPTNDSDDDDNVMTSLPTTGTTGTTDNHNRQQQRLVEQRLGVLDHCARTGVEQASHAYLAYIGTVHQLNLAINQEVC